MVLQIKDLRLFLENGRKLEIVRGLNLKISEGESLGLIGESGAGKSLTALSILSLLPERARLKGEIIFKGRDLLRLSSKEKEKVRGKEISMIFQEPGVSLDPLFTIGNQIGEAVNVKSKIQKSASQIRDYGSRRRKTRMPKSKIIEETKRLLEMVRMPEPEKVMHQYPHQLSGGMQQRVMIAMAISGSPSLLIADEPTTSLDVKTGKEIISLLFNLKKEMGISLLFISHNLSEVYQIADRIAIIYTGKILEEAKKEEIRENPLHPYTKGLFACLPENKKKGERLFTIPGQQPEPGNIPPGCPFSDRCFKRIPICSEKEPPFKEIKKGHFVSCWNI